MMEPTMSVSMMSLIISPHHPGKMRENKIMGHNLINILVYCKLYKSKENESKIRKQDEVLSRHRNNDDDY